MSEPDPHFPSGFPFEALRFAAQANNEQWGPWSGPFGRTRGHGKHGWQHDSNTAPEEQRPDDDASETMRPTPDDDGSSGEDAQPPRASAHPPPPPGAYPPPPPPPPPPPHAFRWHHPGAGRGGFERGRGRHRRGGHRGCPIPPYTDFTAPFDFGPLMHTLAHHPLFDQASRDYTEQSARPNKERTEENKDKFMPPVDIYDTEKAYILHLALPGASREDIGVHWHPKKGCLAVSGVVCRPGDEEFLQSLISGERKIGMFERSIELPPAGSGKEEIDEVAITAKMVNGILIITVPKVEKDSSWTEIHKIDVD